jgi:hypothetical protein
MDEISQLPTFAIFKQNERDLEDKRGKQAAKK